MSKGPSPGAVGGFVVGAVVIAVALAVALGSGRLFARSYPFVVYFAQSVDGLQPGAPVKFKGVTIGTVRTIRISIRGARDSAVRLQDARIPVIFDIDQRALAREGIGWVDLEDAATVRTWIDDGMRVVPTLESVVTGRKYLSLEVLPQTPVYLVNAPELDYPELPAGPEGGFGELSVAIQEAVYRISSLDLDSAVLAFTATMHSIENLIEQDLDRSANELPRTMAQLDSTLRAIRSLAVALEEGFTPLRTDLVAAVESATSTSTELRNLLVGLQASTGPDSPLLAKLEEALTRFAAASYAIETLAEYLARNPSAPLRGKPEPDKDDP